MSDMELWALMQDTKRWPLVLRSFKYGHKASGGLVLRAQELFMAGAPVVDPLTKKLVRVGQ